MDRSIRASRRSLVALMAAALMTVALGAPAAAATPQEVHIVSLMYIPFTEPSTGTFEATGSGLICSSGTVVDVGVVVGGFQSGRGGQILVHKQFTCNDGTGTISVELKVHFTDVGQGGVPTGPFTWVVLGGTGAYQDLRGSGDGVGVPVIDENHVLDTYEGFLVS